jgi:hypothetical protein
MTVRVRSTCVDWARFEAEVGAVAADERARLIDAARAIVAAHGEPVLPKHVDAFVAAAEARGASVAELAGAQRAGSVLVRVGRASRSEPPPPLDEASLPVPDAPLPPGPPPPLSPEPPPLSPEPPPLPPEVLAQMPASWFAARNEEPPSRLDALAARYAVAFDLAAIGVGLVTFVVSLWLRQPIGERAVLSSLVLRRALQWVGSVAFLVGVGGFAKRAGLLDGPLYDRLGNRTLRLRFLQEGALVAIRGVLVLAGALLLVATLALRSCGDATPPRPAADPELRSPMLLPDPAALPR